MYSIGEHPKVPDETFAVTLPVEILLKVLSYVPASPTSQTLIHAFGLVCRSWYLAALPRLYHTPHITTKSFDRFVSTICPSINAHIRKTDLANLVRVLDMSRLVYSGSKSLTARLLSRLKESLEVLVAPQTSFACV